MNHILHIFDLRINYLSGYNFIGDLTPSFSWKLAGISGTMQKCYRIYAASTIELLATPDLWDSNWIESSNSINIKYAGKALESRQQVFWKVAIQDQNGNECISETASFEIALIGNNQWKGNWIFLNNSNSSSSSPCPFFRKEFNLKETPKRATLYITARGLFEARINGKRVGNDHFVPGWTDFNKQIQYMSYDVTSYLTTGKNAAGVILGDGWYCGYLSGRVRNTYGKHPELLFQLEILYNNGNKEILTSKKGWKCTTGPILYSDIYDGEEYDARLEMLNWDMPDFDDSKWQKVSIGEKAISSPKLVAKCCPPVRRITELKPRKILNPQKDIYIWDFGQNITGRMKVRLKGYPGRLYSFHFAEMLNPDGTLYNLNYRSAKSTDYYICKGPVKEYEEYEPSFTFHGFRYLQINGFQYSGATLEDIEVVAIVMHSDLESTGSFECGVEKVNQLFSNVCWGQRDNFFEIPTDCPQRDERLGWTGDANIFAATAAFNMNVCTFFKKWLRDLREAQRKDGAVPCIVPNLFNHSWGAAAWADAAVLIPFVMYQKYADTSLLKDSFTSMKKWVDYQKNTSLNLIRPRTSFGDWLALSQVETPSELIGTAFFAKCAQTVSLAASILNKKKEAKYYNDLALNIKKSFQNEFLLPDGLLKIKSQTACVLALEFDLLETEDIAKNAQLLVSLIKENDNKLSTGFVGTAFISLALSKAGYSSVAYDLLLQEEYPSWLFSVNQGATTIWERWNSYTIKDGFGNVNMNSFNHYSYGAVANWMTSCAGGIRFDDSKPGGKKIIFAAEPDRRLKFVNTTLETVYGQVKSQWKFVKDCWIWNISAPCNTEILVKIPELETETILLNNQEINQQEIHLSNGLYEIKIMLIK